MTCFDLFVTDRNLTALRTSDYGFGDESDACSSATARRMRDWGLSHSLRPWSCKWPGCESICEDFGQFLKWVFYSFLAEGVDYMGVLGNFAVNKQKKAEEESKGPS